MATRRCFQNLTRLNRRTSFINLHQSPLTSTQIEVPEVFNGNQKDISETADQRNRWYAHLYQNINCYFFYRFDSQGNLQIRIAILFIG